jgi:hypothetical protein
LSVISFAQDTNFPVGPQYLITSSSSMFLRPISTPSLSLSQLPPVTSIVSEAAATLAEETPVSSGVTSQTFFSTVYWGDHTASEIDARFIVTPSLSLSATPAPEAETTAANAPSLPSSAQPASSVIEISSAPLPRPLPPSFFDTGVTGIADSRSLIERGYGLTLGEVASYWKSHKRPASRVFTNSDLRSPHS